MFGLLAAGVLVYEGFIHLAETQERWNYYNYGRDYCTKTGKQLLRIGVRRGVLEPPMGDVTLDIDPVVLNYEGGVLGDERHMPFADKQFGVCFNEHTLEHLETPKDVELAVNECIRVADIAILLAPSPYGIYATFFCPLHNLRLWFDNENNTIKVAENKYITGVGVIAPAIGNENHQRIGQAIQAQNNQPVKFIIV